MVHVLDALAGIFVDPLPDAGEPRHIPGRRVVGFGHTEAPAVAALALGVGHVPGAALRLIGLPIAQPVLFGLTQIAGEDARVRADMCVGIEDPETVACHGVLPSDGCRDLLAAIGR